MSIGIGSANYVAGCGRKSACIALLIEYGEFATSVGNRLWDIAGQDFSRCPSIAINSWCRTQGARVSARVVIDFAPSLSLSAGNAWDVSRIPPGPTFERQVKQIARIWGGMPPVSEE